MTRGRTQPPSGTGGFTLVELLVVLLILAIIGAIVSSSITRGLRADAQARDRIEAFEDMQIAMERMSREVRAANPVEEADAAPGDEVIKVQVLRGTQCLHFTYERSDLNSDTINVTQERFEEDCSTVVGSASTQPLISGLEPTTPFVEFLDEAGDPIKDPDDLGSGDTVVNPRDIVSVRISFERVLELDQSPVTVSTTVGVRNR